MKDVSTLAIEIVFPFERLSMRRSCDGWVDINSDMILLFCGLKAEYMGDMCRRKAEKTSVRTTAKA
jgi:hypothetical protein